MILLVRSFAGGASKERDCGDFKMLRNLEVQALNRKDSVVLRSNDTHDLGARRRYLMEKPSGAWVACPTIASSRARNHF